MILGESLVSHEYDQPRDKCAVAGFISFEGKNVAPYLHAQLLHQQNRGQDGAGIAMIHRGTTDIISHRDKGLVNNVFADMPRMIQHGFVGDVGVGHTRYATDKTAEANNPRGYGPFVAKYNGLEIALAHNGNIGEPFLSQLRQQLPQNLPLVAGTDSELLAWKIVMSPGENWTQRIRHALGNIPGAYALTMATNDGQLIGIRDPHEIRPLVLAHLQGGAALVSETHGLKHMMVNKWEDVKGGQMVTIDKSGAIRYQQAIVPRERTSCVVEGLYFQHPHSFEREGGEENAEIRRKIGEQLAREYPLADLLALLGQKGIHMTDPRREIEFAGIPDSGADFALGYAEFYRMPPSLAIRKERYLVPERSFIQADHEARNKVLEEKFSISTRVNGKVVITFDDTGVRGNTDRRLNAALRANGARAVVALKGAPKIINPCDMGVDIATKAELIGWDSERGRERTDEEIAEQLGLDLIRYITPKGMMEAFGDKGFCYQCMGGPHPLHK